MCGNYSLALKTLYYSLPNNCNNSFTITDVTTEQKQVIATTSHSKLITDMKLFERKSAANFSGTPAETLKLLATDKNENVRECVAFNPSTPLETLEVLATDINNYAL